MKKLLTEAQAWRLIAKKLLDEGRVEEGICLEVSKLNVNNTVAHDTYVKMFARLIDYRRSHADLTNAGAWAGTFVYACSHHHEARATACLWMALEAEEEARHLKKNAHLANYTIHRADA